MPSIAHLVIGFILIASVALSQESVITVGPNGCDFYRIESALDSAHPGDIIEVQSGEYYVNLNITTPLLTLRGKDTGEGRPVLRAGSSTADALSDCRRYKYGSLPSGELVENARMILNYPYNELIT